MEGTWLIPIQASMVTGVSTRTLARWADEGKIKAKKLPGGWRTYKLSSLTVYMNKREKVAEKKILAGRK